MKAYRRFSTTGQMATSVAIFAALLLLFESGGLADWAQRLDLGPERSVAVPLTGALHRAVGRLGFERARQDALIGLARAGWSDDPALAASSSKPLPPARLAASRTPVLPVAAAPAVAALAPVATVSGPVADADTVPPARRRITSNPPLVNSLPALAPLAEGKTRTVVLAGDSMMAVGLSPSMLRAAPQYRNLTLIRAFKSGTGLARPEIFNWATEYPAMLGAAKPDVVVVAIGANDGQGFVEGGVTYPFGTTAWQAIYRARVTAYLAMLQADGATVVWLGLPPMKSEAYDDRIALVNRIDYEIVSASPRAVWFSSAGIVGDPSGRFQDFGSVHGTIARLRQPDGIHLSDEGATLISEKLLPWLANGQ